MGILRRIIDSTLHPLGLHLTRFPVSENNNAPNGVLLARYQELEGCYRDLLFPEIPERANRSQLMQQLLGTSPGEAMYILGALHRSMSCPGDVCEFGVAQGATSALLANEIRGTDKKLWLFDSFEGLPRPTEKDKLIDDIFNLGSMEAYAGQMACDVSMVKGRLETVGFPLNRVEIVPGFIEKTINLPKVPRSVAFAYVDFDFYEPILIALNYLNQTMPAGGHIVVDDYGWFSSGAQTAVDEFVSANVNDYELTFPIKSAGHFAVLRRKSARPA
jgi:O-methyltransferase